MSRFWLTTFLVSVLGANLVAQSPAPTSAAQTGPKSPAQPTSSPSATPTVEELVDSLGPADLQTLITLLKANFTDPDAITDTELNRATVEGLLVRLPRGITLLASKESVPPATPGAFYSELIAGRTGYVRLGTLNNTNLQALDKALSGFAVKKVNDLIVDLRASSATSDLSLAAAFAKRLRLHCGSTTRHSLSANQLQAVPPNTQTCHCPMAKVCGSPWLKWFRPRVGHYFPKA